MTEKTVTFLNVRTGKGGSKPPWMNSGYTDQHGQSVQWGQIPIYDENGNPRTFVKDGQVVPVLWEGTGTGKSTIFTMGKKQTVVLNRNIHKDVIKALRDAPFCESSKKSKDAVRMHAVWLREYEPEVIEKAQLDIIEKDMRLGDLFSVFTRMAMNNDPNADLVLGLAGYDFPKIEDTLNKRRIFLKGFVTANPDKFLSWFDENDRFTMSMVNAGILETAVKKGVIVLIGNDYIYDGQNLGPNLSEVPVKFSSAFQRITSALKPEISSVREEEE